jgi:hypothetical protein
MRSKSDAAADKRKWNYGVRRSAPYDLIFGYDKFYGCRGAEPSEIRLARLDPGHVALISSVGGLRVCP